jgi:hypothetical protein
MTPIRPFAWMLVLPLVMCDAGPEAQPPQAPPPTTLRPGPAIGTISIEGTGCLTKVASDVEIPAGNDSVKWFVTNGCEKTVTVSTGDFKRLRGNGSASPATGVNKLFDVLDCPTPIEVKPREFGTLICQVKADGCRRFDYGLSVCVSVGGKNYKLDPELRIKGGSTGAENECKKVETSQFCLS